MKTTFDLPPDIIREMKLRALNEGRKLKEIAADLLRMALGLGQGAAQPPAKAPVYVPKTLPVIHANLPDSERPKLTDEEFLKLIKEAEMEIDVKAAGY